MTQIFLVRHGEAEGNYYRRAQGQTDGELMPRGYAQIEYLKKRFESIPLHAAYSSDLKRAYETACEALKGKGIAVTKRTDLREVGLGIWENQAWGNIERDCLEQLENFILFPERWSVPGSEAYAEVQDRMENALRNIAETHNGQSVLVASHGMAIRSLLARILHRERQDIAVLAHPGNTAVALLEVSNGTVTVKYTNDDSHLPPALTDPVKKNWWESNVGSNRKNLWFSPFPLDDEMPLFLSCYRDAWRIAHGNLAGFDESACARSALAQAAGSGTLIWAARLGEDFAGILSLDEQRGKDAGIGWIAFCYVVPEFRRRRYGAQLIGQAAAVYQALGRSSLRLTVAPSNPALGFYERLNFRRMGTTPGAVESLLMMEKSI